MEPVTPQPIAVKATPTLPWDRVDFYGCRPIDSDYGYYEQTGRWPRYRLRSRACTREELIARIEDLTATRVTQVWTIESPNVRSVREAPFLQDAVVRRVRKDAKSGIKSGILHLVVWLSLAFMITRIEYGAYMHYLPGVLIPAAFFGFFPLVRGCASLIGARNFSPASLRRSARTMRFQEWLARGRAPTIQNLCIALIALGSMQLIIDDSSPFKMPASLDSAGLLKSEVRNGEYWRLITGTLLHGGSAHLFMNCFALFLLGRFVVQLTNGPMASLVLFLSALGGSLASLVFMPDIPTVGFSGAILGLFGFLVALGRRRPSVIPRNFRRLLFADLIFITLVGLALFQIIDNAAHLGGLLTGGLIGFAAISRHGSEFPVAPRAGVNALGWASHAVLMGFVGLTFWKCL